MNARLPLSPLSWKLRAGPSKATRTRPILWRCSCFWRAAAQRIGTTLDAACSTRHHSWRSARCRTKTATAAQCTCCWCDTCTRFASAFAHRSCGACHDTAAALAAQCRMPPSHGDGGDGGDDGDGRGDGDGGFRPPKRIRFLQTLVRQTDSGSLHRLRAHGVLQ